MRSEDSLSTILLVGRNHSEGMRPLRVSEYWRLLQACPRPGVLLGQDRKGMVRDHGLSDALADRIRGLLDRVRVMAFELEQLEHSGIWTVTYFDDDFPQRLVCRLGPKAPALLHAAGDVGLLDQPGIGVVGSRDVSPEGAEAARGIAEKAVELGCPVVSGGARGVDQLAMNAAMQAGGDIIGVLAGSFMRRLQSPDVRRAIHEERAVMCTPYSPKTPFRVWNAMGRNKIIYALSKITVAVAGEMGKGGTWSGATEALEGGLRVGVWRGAGEGPGNEALEKRGAVPIRSVDELEAKLHPLHRDGGGLSEGGSSRPEQLSMFGKTA